MKASPRKSTYFPLNHVMLLLGLRLIPWKPSPVDMYGSHRPNPYNEMAFKDQTEAAPGFKGNFGVYEPILFKLSEGQL